jgi:glyoxylase-like metal-dependent hydrolase (beta-lactamase superfamily II)
VNLFLVKTGPGIIAIDAGQSAQGIAEALRGAGFAIDAVRHVFLTHSDSDHAGGLGAFGWAMVYLGAEEEPLITGQRTRFLGLTHSPRLAVPYTLLSDGQTLELYGATVRVIATPGHTPGSTSYLVDGQLLFTGDTIALRKGIARPFPAILDMDRPALPASLHRLAALPSVALLCTAHTGCTTDWAGAMAQWRAPAG